MEFLILGAFEVRDEGREIAVAGPKLRALLAILALHVNEPVSAERLAIALWGEDVPAASIGTLQVHVSRLRRLLGHGEVLETTATGYRLHAGPDDVDAKCFERRSAAGLQALRDGDPVTAASLLREALELWRGPALADFEGTAFAQAEIARLEEQRQTAIEARVEADLVVGRHTELVGELQQRVADQPYRERPYAQLMLALYRCGRQADALAVFARARATLVDGLGLEPGAELRRLERQILEQDTALSAPLAARGVARVPLPPTATIGRSAELERVVAMLAEPAARLVTVVGPGGVGKTRLALEAAHAAAGAFSEGADFVSLAGASDPEDVASVIVRELGIRVLAGEATRSAALRHLQRREQLLILDNFEHVLGAAPLVAELLTAHRALKVIVTSREPLNIGAERLFRLGPLDLEESAVRLFHAVAKARAHDIGERDAGAVADICARLDGLPLAIELAASRIGVLSAGELGTRLRSGLDALGSARRDAPARQRTLLATLEWSYALATPTEREALTALAAFAGSCSLAAAEAVTRAPLEALEALVAKNLVIAERGRFKLLETVRAFALARLDQRADAQEIRRRHCEHYLSVAEPAAAEFDRNSSRAALAEFEIDSDNFRAALAWSLARPAPELALRLVTELRFYWRERNLNAEAARWSTAALALDADAVPIPVRAAALEAHGFNLSGVHLPEAAEAVLEESLRLRRSIGDERGCALSLCALGYQRLAIHAVEDSYRFGVEAQEVAERCGDADVRIDAIQLRAMMAPTLAEALELGAVATAARRAAGNERRFALLVGSLAYTALFHDAPETAARLSREALDVARAIDYLPGITLSLGNAGLAALFSDDPDEARASFLAQLRLGDGDRNEPLIYEALHGLAAHAAHAGDDRLAATLSGAADARSEGSHDPLIAERMEQRFFMPARARLGSTAWLQAHAAGMRLEREQVLEAAARGPRGALASM